MIALMLLAAAAPDAMVAPDANRGRDVNAIVTLPDTVKPRCQKRKRARLAKRPARP